MVDDAKEQLRRALVEARGRSGLSLSALAMEAGVGVSTVANYESLGVPKRTTPNLVAIATVLGVDLTAYGYAATSTVPARGPIRETGFIYRHHTFGREMKAVRINHDLTQAALTRRMKTCQATLCYWERGMKLPQARSLYIWCEALGENFSTWRARLEQEQKK